MDGGCGATLGDRREEESGARVCRWGGGVGRESGTGGSAARSLCRGWEKQGR